MDSSKLKDNKKKYINSLKDAAFSPLNETEQFESEYQSFLKFDTHLNTIGKLSETYLAAFEQWNKASKAFSDEINRFHQNLQDIADSRDKMIFKSATESLSTAMNTISSVISHSVDHVIRSEVLGTTNHLTKQSFPSIKLQVKERAHLMAELDSQHRVLTTYEKLQDQENIEKYLELLEETEKKLDEQTRTLTANFHAINSKHCRVLNYLTSSAVIGLSTYYQKAEQQLKNALPLFETNAGVLTASIDESIARLNLKQTLPTVPCTATNCLNANPDLIDTKSEPFEEASLPLRHQADPTFIPPTLEDQSSLAHLLEDYEPKDDMVIALTNYEAQNDDELSFDVGDEITVLKSSDTGICEGVCNGVTGLFYACFTKPVSDGSDWI